MSSSCERCKDLEVIAAELTRLKLLGRGENTYPIVAITECQIKVGEHTHYMMPGTELHIQVTMRYDDNDRADRNRAPDPKG